MNDDLSSWRIRPSRSNFAGRHLKVYSPGCAASPHAERNCRCRTFNAAWRAEQYRAEQIALDNGED